MYREDVTRWLDPDEMRAWRGLVEVFVGVQARLATDFAAHGLDDGDYGVLVNLSEAADGRMRMCDLAGVLHLSPSGLTRRIDSMVRRGLVERVASEDDRRVTLAALTPAGLAAIEDAAPGHVEAVRRNFLDHLSPEQMRALGDAMDAVRAGLTQDRAPHP